MWHALSPIQPRLRTLLGGTGKIACKNGFIVCSAGLSAQLIRVPVDVALASSPILSRLHHQYVRM
jgi:hypothetical protein